MSQPVTITATVAAWISQSQNPLRITEAIQQGKALEAINSMIFYGAPEREKLADWIRVGEADVTVRLMPRDEQVRMAVQLLQGQLDQARAEWLTRQQDILARINQLQAISFDAEPVAITREAA